MSKQNTMQQMRPISNWLKKEHQLEKKTESDESKSIIQIEQSVKICLERFDKNINPTKILDRKIHTKIVNNKNLNRVDNIHIADDNSRRLRSSTRHLKSPEEELEENPIVKESDIKDLPPIVFNGSINYVSDFYECANICDKLLIEINNSTDEVIPVGFDLEWPFNFQTGSGKTALAQICFNEETCYLLHIYHLKKLPASFIVLLTHPKVKLVGVNIKNDIWKLTRDFKEFPGQKVVTDNCLDCGPYVNKVFNLSGRWSLERLTAYLLKKRINKDPAVRRSKWHIQPLNDAQKLYAATDAYVSLLLHLTIEEQRKKTEANTEQESNIAPTESESNAATIESDSNAATTESESNTATTTEPESQN